MAAFPAESLRSSPSAFDQIALSTMATSTAASGGKGLAASGGDCDKAERLLLIVTLA